ncbi:hypothetical protein [Microvirga ossetica]|uniref:hypothetical protein n=1 Tax=Microvirga ossetica TaxID=1882682 RepID=UPI001F229A5B|nr:hypothetical protein [Microvirga ossetica]
MKRLGHGTQGLSPHTEYDCQTCLGNLNSVSTPGPVMRMEQAAGTAGLEPMETSARGRLDRLLEKHLAETQKQVVQWTVRSADRQKAVEREACCRSWNLNDGAAQRSIVIPKHSPKAKVSFRPNGCGFDGTAVLHRRDEPDDAAVREQCFPHRLARLLQDAATGQGDDARVLGHRG